MSDQASEKQHQASSKRIDELRRKGQVMRSRDLTAGLIFIVTVILFVHLSPLFKSRIEQNFHLSFSRFDQVISDPDYIAHFITKLTIENLLLLSPIFIVILIITYLSPFLFGGWNFTLEAVQFNISKLNPMNYIKNILSFKIVLEMLRSLLKAIVIFGVFICFIIDKKYDIGQLAHLPVKEAIGGSFIILEKFIVIISVSLIFLIIFDVLYHFWEFQNRIKMTTQELKDEHKDTEGNPEVKRKVRRAQFALLKQRLSSAVPQANVIVTNPTHYAIALRYNSKKDHAPKVMAKGRGHIAQQIRTIAIAHAIPIYQAPSLARALYHTANIGSEIHPDLYRAVAIVLTYVHQLKNYQQGVGEMPNYICEFEIPKDFIYEE